MDATCAKCGEEFAVRDACDPTPYCDQCAHEMLDLILQGVRDCLSICHEGEVRGRLVSILEYANLKTVDE